MANIKGSQREKHLKVYILNNFELRNWAFNRLFTILPFTLFWNCYNNKKFSLHYFRPHCNTYYIIGIVIKVL